MSYQARVLPPDEWSRLARLGSDLSVAWPQLPTDGSVTIVVVEDHDGTIVGAWSCFQCLHLEGVWVADAHRKRGVVAGRLLDGMFATLRARGITAAITNADTPEIARVLTHLDATRLPGEQYLVKIGAA